MARHRDMTLPDEGFSEVAAWCLLDPYSGVQWVAWRPHEQDRANNIYHQQKKMEVLKLELSKLERGDMGYICIYLATPKEEKERRKKGRKERKKTGGN